MAGVIQFLEFTFHCFWHFAGVIVLAYVAIMPLLVLAQSIRAKTCRCAKVGKAEE